MKKRFQSQEGGILILVTIAMGTVLSMTALAVDVGYIVSTRGQLEKAADAAALAAIGKAYTPAATAEGIARDFALQHTAGGKNVLLSSVELGQFDFPAYFANGNANAAFLPGATPITAARVVAARDATVATGPLELYFARIFGVKNVAISRRATAVLNPYVSGAPARTHVIPLAVHESLVEDAGGNIKVGALVDIRLRPEKPAPALPAGGFGWLSTLWDQSHAPDVPGLRDAIENGLAVDARTPATVYGTPGTKGGSLNPAFQELTNLSGDETSGAYGGSALKTQKNCAAKGKNDFSTCTGATQPLSCVPKCKIYCNMYCRNLVLQCGLNFCQSCSQCLTGSCVLGLACPDNEISYCDIECQKPWTPQGAWFCPTQCSVEICPLVCTGGDDYDAVANIVNRAVVYIPVYSTSSEQGVGALFQIEYFIAAEIENVILTGALAQRRVEIRVLGTPTFPPYVTSDLFLDQNAPPNPTLQKLMLIE